MPQVLFRLLLLAGALVASAPADAAVRALVVGVSRYERADLAGSALPGAAVDAAAFAKRVREQGADVTLLTGEAARLAAIDAQLARLADATRAGDRLVLYLAGHGVQAPARGRDEPDGLDEWFLAADAGRWNARTRALPGALRDKAIGERIAAVRARGGDVWLIVDACSGGGLSRGEAGNARRIDPRLLSLGGYAGRGAVASDGLIDARTLPGLGRVVLFQAAAPGAIAWERTLADDGAVPTRRGLFTWSLLRAWRSVGGAASFADLAAAAERERMAAGPPGGAALIAGDLAQPILFQGQARDLLTLAQAAAPLAVDVAIGVGSAGATCPGPVPTRVAPIGEGAVRVRGCRAIAVEVTTTQAEQRIVAWYRDARGDAVALTGALPRRVSAVEPATIDFVASDRDPRTGARLPTGREYLILLSEDGRRGRVVAFDTGG